MRLFDREKLACSKCGKADIVQSVRRGVWRPVVHVGAGQTVFLRKTMVDSSSEEVFVHYLLPDKRVETQVTVCQGGTVGVGKMPKRQISRSVRVHGYVA